MKAPKNPILLVMVLSFFATIFWSAAQAEDITIEMLNKRDKEKMVYSEDVVRINVGDTITWVPSSKGHNVHFIAGPEGWELPKKSKTTKKFQ